MKEKKIGIALKNYDHHNNMISPQYSLITFYQIDIHKKQLSSVTTIIKMDLKNYMYSIQF